MKLIDTDKHNRTLIATNFPVLTNGYTTELDELEITINYTGPGSATKGVILDNVIIPFIKEAVNNL